MLNKHNLQMNGLKSAAGATKSLQGYWSPSYVQISYNLTTGAVLANYHVSLGQNNWTVYDDADIITICNITNKITMQQLADIIAEHVEQFNACNYAS